MWSRKRKAGSAEGDGESPWASVGASVGAEKAGTEEEEKAVCVATRRFDTSCVVTKARLADGAEKRPSTVTEAQAVFIDPTFPLAVVYVRKDGTPSKEIYPFADQALEDGLRKGDAEGTAAALLGSRRPCCVVHRDEPGRPSPTPNDLLVDAATEFLRFAKTNSDGLLVKAGRGGEGEQQRQRRAPEDEQQRQRRAPEDEQQRQRRAPED